MNGCGILSGQSQFRQAAENHSVDWCKTSTLPINTSAEVIRLAVMMYTRYPLSPGWVEDLLLEHGIEIRHEIARLSRNLGRSDVCV